MLRSLAEPEGYRLEALDGDIGRCHDFLFDDERWALRYMVADTGRWLSGRKVLISPAQLQAPDWERKRMPVKLTKAQIEQSPDLDADAPVSRRYEQLYNEFHALPSYWLGSGLWGDFPIPASLTAPQEARIEPVSTTDSDAIGSADLERGDDVHLRSVREVTGYGVVGSAAEGGSDEKIGRVVDLLFDDSSWALRAFVVDTSRLPFSKKILLPVEVVAEIDWVSQQVSAELPATRLEEAPPYDASESLEAQLESLLQDLGQRPHASV